MIQSAQLFGHYQCTFAVFHEESGLYHTVIGVPNDGALEDIFPPDTETTDPDAK